LLYSFQKISVNEIIAVRSRYFLEESKKILALFFTCHKKNGAEAPGYFSKFSLRTSKKLCGCSQTGQSFGALTASTMNPQLRHSQSVFSPLSNYLVLLLRFQEVSDNALH